MNCLPVFYQESVYERYSFTNSGEEKDICPICEEKQVNIMLDCYVKIRKIFFSISFVKSAFKPGCLIKKTTVHYVDLMLI